MGGGLLDALREILQLEYVDNGAYELASSQRYGAGLKQLHNDRIVRKLDRVRMLKGFCEKRVTFRLLCKYRSFFLSKLETETEVLKQNLVASGCHE